MTGMPRVTVLRPDINYNPEPNRVTRRVLVGRPSPESRLYLEIDTTCDADITRRFLRHIDDVREMLVSGRVTPDDAHAMLVDVSWLSGGRSE